MECLQEIRRQKLPLRVLVLTMHSEQQYIREVMLRGADGYLRKDTLDTELFRALRTVAAGKRYIAEEDARLLIDSLIDEPEEAGQTLSAREQEVLELLVHGYSLSVIAEKLYISIKTVSTYKTRLMLKLGCTQKSELVEYALKHKLL